MVKLNDSSLKAQAFCPPPSITCCNSREGGEGRRISHRLHSVNDIRRVPWYCVAVSPHTFGQLISWSVQHRKRAVSRVQASERDDGIIAGDGKGGGMGL